MYARLVGVVSTQKCALSSCGRFIVVFTAPTNKKGYIVQAIIDLEPFKIGTIHQLSSGRTLTITPIARQLILESLLPNYANLGITTTEGFVACISMVLEQAANVLQILAKADLVAIPKEEVNPAPWDENELWPIDRMSYVGQLESENEM